MRIKGKYYVSQISAIIIGFAVSSITVISIRRICQPNFSPGFLSTVVFGILLVFIVCLSLYLWGRFLVMVGILSEDEAKGYPYSKPWEKS